MTKRTVDWTVEERNSIIERWIDRLNKLIGFIRRKEVKQALKKLKYEAKRKQKQKQKQEQKQKQKQKQFKKEKRIDEDNEVDSIE